MAKYDFKTIEPGVLEFWKKHKIYQKAVEKNKGKEKFYYLDGPPYTTGAIHVGHAWGRALRDPVLRFKRMSGFAVRDRPGFDMHGLPIEVKVEKKLGIKNKQEIVSKIGLKKFTEECKKFAVENLWPMVDDFKRMGVWMDWDNTYMTVKNEYIEGAWWALSKAHKNGHLYQGKKSMTWCPRCGSALAKHELEYENRNDPSIFVKLQIQNKPKEFLVVWTTTPWTIPFNMAVMVHPELEYVKVNAKDEVWIIAKDLVKKMSEVSKTELEVTETFKGKALEGVKYEHPFKQEVEFHQKVKDAHKVVLSDKYVSTADGSGLVHCAPGCGGEDFEVGKEQGLEAFNETDEHGAFTEEMGPLKGLTAKADDEKFIQLMKDKGVLLAQKSISHEYAHCWRCKTPVIFRATPQWFLGMEKLRDKMLEQNKTIIWQPESAKNAFNSWLSNLQDWCISRQRFWGIPLPIWVSDDDDVIVVGTRKELKELTGKELEDLHRPFIDEVKVEKNGKTYTRIPDVLDVWLDSGVSPWATLGYPSETELFDELGFPDFILEGRDMIRGWFNSLACMGMISFGKIPYKSVFMHGMINDSQGRKMSKSLGNTISPYEIIDAYGADTLRYYTTGGAKPGLDLNFNHQDAKTKQRNLIVYWNVHNYLIELAKELKVNPKDLDKDEAKEVLEACGVEEKFMHAKLQQTIKDVTQMFDELRINEIPWALEDLLLTLSRSYIQMTREKSALGSDKEKKVVLHTIWTVFRKGITMLATVAPFITEQMWQNLRKEFKLDYESVHLRHWPTVREDLVNDHLVEQMTSAEQVIQSILAAREKAKLSVRWPVKSVTIVSHDNHVLESVDVLSDVIKTQTNVKELCADQELAEVKTTIKANAGELGKSFGKLSPQIIAKLSQMSANDILSKLSRDGKVALKIDGQDVELGQEHVSAFREAPKHLVSVEFKGGSVYLNTERNDELDTEGFAREIMRRVQQLRKESGLEKSDEVNVHVEVSEGLAKRLHDWQKTIAEKCGAKQVKVASKLEELKHVSEGKIRSENVKVSLTKA